MSSMLNTNNIFSTTITSEVTGKDVNQNEFIIIRMLCNITDKGVSYNFDIVEQNMFELNKEFCKAEVGKFKLECENKARALGIDIL